MDFVLKLLLTCQPYSSSFQGWQKPGFFQKNPTRVGFFGFYWVFLGFIGVFLGFIGFFEFSPKKMYFFLYLAFLLT
jgi:hypothetical protein